MTTSAVHGASHDRTNTHQLFYRDGLRHPFTIKRSVLNDVRALEARRWRMVQRANAWWARSSPLIEALADAGGIAHAHPRASGISGWAEGWIKIKVEDASDAYFDNLGRAVRSWSWDWLKAAPCPPLHVDLAVALLKHWARGAQINAARLNFDAVLEKSIQDALLVRAAEHGVSITNEHTYQVQINGRSYWYTGVWWTRGENMMHRLAWPGDEMETVEL